MALAADFPLFASSGRIELEYLANGRAYGFPSKGLVVKTRPRSAKDHGHAALESHASCRYSNQRTHKDLGAHRSAQESAVRKRTHECCALFSFSSFGTAHAEEPSFPASARLERERDIVLEPVRETATEEAARFPTSAECHI